MAKSKIFKTEVNSIPAGGQWECQLELDGEACGIIISNDAQLMHPNAQHFWDIHPEPLKKIKTLSVWCSNVTAMHSELDCV